MTLLASECLLILSPSYLLLSRLNTRTPTIITLLYGENEIEETMEIWDAFEKARCEFEDVGDEDREAEEAVDGLGGGGTLEEAENGRRDLNGEFELAIRGYGE